MGVVTLGGVLSAPPWARMMPYHWWGRARDGEEPQIFSFDVLFGVPVGLAIVFLN